MWDTNVEVEPDEMLARFAGTVLTATIRNGTLTLHYAKGRMMTVAVDEDGDFIIYSGQMHEC